MLDWRRLGARYSRLTWSQRLGNFASTLARSARSLKIRAPRFLSQISCARECGSSNGAPPPRCPPRSPSWRRCNESWGLLRRAWEVDADALRAVVAFRTRAMSDHVLELSGLLSLPTRYVGITPGQRLALAPQLPTTLGGH